MSHNDSEQIMLPNIHCQIQLSCLYLRYYYCCYYSLLLFVYYLHCQFQEMYIHFNTQLIFFFLLWFEMNAPLIQHSTVKRSSPFPQFHQFSIYWSNKIIQFHYTARVILQLCKDQMRSNSQSTIIFYQV